MAAENVVSIEVSGMEDIAKIQEACENGSAVNVTLKNDVTFDVTNLTPTTHIEIKEGWTVTLDLAGYSISSNTAGAFLVNRGTLTINDSSAQEGSHGVGQGPYLYH